MNKKPVEELTSNKFNNGVCPVCGSELTENQDIILKDYGPYEFTAYLEVECSICDFYITEQLI